MLSDVYKLFRECTNFEEAIKILNRDSWRLWTKATCNQNSTGSRNLRSVSASIVCSGKRPNLKMLLLKFTKRKLWRYLYFWVSCTSYLTDFLKTKCPSSQKLVIKCKLWKGLSWIGKPILLIPKQVIKQC